MQEAGRIFCRKLSKADQITDDIVHVINYSSVNFTVSRFSTLAQYQHLASFPGSPGARICIAGRAWYLFWLSTPAQLQCLRSGAWEPGNEANQYLVFHKLLFLFLNSMSARKPAKSNQTLPSLCILQVIL